MPIRGVQEFHRDNGWPMVKDYSKLIKKLDNPGELILYRVSGNGTRRMVILSEEEWKEIVNLLGRVSQ